jgi:FdhD protein
LCGIDSLKEAVRPVAHVAGGARISPQHIMQAVASVVPAQALNHETRAVHAAAFWHPDPDRGLVALREDVGRHNALDKVVGWAYREGLLPLSRQILCVSGRLSFELVQKAAVAGCPILVAVGAPSSLAVELARDRGITLCGFVRNGRLNVYSEPWRVERE